MEIFNDLRKTSIFSDASENDILAMAHCFNIKIKTFTKNSVIVESGKPLDDIILIIKGSAIIQSYDANGEISILMKLQSGDVFGVEGAYAGKGSYFEDLVASEKTTIAFLSKHRVCNPCENRCKRHIKLARELMTIIANKNFELLDKIACMSKKTIREKVLYYLYNQSIKNNTPYFEIPFNKTELASYLSVDRSALSKELNNLKREKVIDFDKKRYHIIKERKTIKQY